MGNVATARLQADEKARDAVVAGIGLAFLICAIAMFGGYTPVFAWCVSLILTLSVALGAMRGGRVGAFKPFLVVALVVWLISFTLMHGLPATIDKLYFGLPPATAVGVFILWFAPLLLVTLPYALLFRGSVLDEKDLQELERMAATQMAARTAAKQGDDRE